MKKITALFFIFILSIPSIAQVPGYMGKRFSIGYSSYFFPRISVFTQKIGIIDDDISTEHLFNSAHCLDMDYVLNNKTSLCLSGQFSKIDLLKHGSKFSVQNDGGSRYYNVIYSPRPKEDMRLNSINISVGFKFFKDRYLNPFGRYRKLELILMMNAVQMDENGFYSQTNDYYQTGKVEPYPLQARAGKFTSLATAYTIGKQRIFFDKLIFDWGIRFGMNYSYVISALNIFTVGESQNESLENELKESSNLRIWGAQTINAHIGLRFLAF